VAGIERDSLLGIHHALFPTNVPVDYVHADRVTPQSLARYRLVFLPYPPMLPERLGGVLREYVAQGGALVAEARAGWNNERGRASPIVPGLGLHEVLGCRESAIQTGAGGRTTLRWSDRSLPGVSAGDVLPARWYEETLEPVSPSARVVAQFAGPEGKDADSGAAAVLAEFGRGKVLTLGSYMSAAYQSRPAEAVQRFYSALLDWAGVEWPVEVDVPGIEVRTLERGPERVAFVFNHGPERREVSLRLRMATVARTAADIVSGAEIPVARDDGAVRVHLDLDPDDVRVVHLF
jgi:beta-galactosidase